MSNAVIHPLLDAAIIQLNSIRFMLGDEPAVHLIDGAKSQLVATKQLLGLDLKPTPKLPSTGYTDFADPPERVPEPAPRVKRKKPENTGVRGHRGYASPPLIREAITRIVADANAPISKNEIDASLIGHEKKFKLNGKVTISSTKSALRYLLKSKVVKKLGERTTARYVLANVEM